MSNNKNSMKEYKKLLDKCYWDMYLKGEEVALEEFRKKLFESCRTPKDKS